MLGRTIRNGRRRGHFLLHSCSRLIHLPSMSGKGFNRTILFIRSSINEAICSVLYSPLHLEKPVHLQSFNSRSSNHITCGTCLVRNLTLHTLNLTLQKNKYRSTHRLDPPILPLAPKLRSRLLRHRNDALLRTSLRPRPPRYHLPGIAPSGRCYDCRWYGDE